MEYSEKRKWSTNEDNELRSLVYAMDTWRRKSWSWVAERITARSGKQCRERWTQHLDPAINKGPWLPEEDLVILQERARIGNQWAQIAKHETLRGRSDNSIRIGSWDHWGGGRR